MKKKEEEEEQEQDQVATSYRMSNDFSSAYDAISSAYDNDTVTAVAVNIESTVNEYKTKNKNINIVIDDEAECYSHQEWEPGSATTFINSIIHGYDRPIQMYDG